MYMNVKKQNFPYKWYGYKLWSPIDLD
jgi:hypothetical protein